MAYSLLTACALGFAWWWPGSWLGLVLTWVGSVLLVCQVTHSPRPLRSLTITGILIQPLGFYWLFETIRTFGAFPWIVALGIFALFVGGSALQFTLFGWLYHRLPRQLDVFSLRAAIAWVVLELILPRIFPWHIGHTQLPFLPLAQIADLFGTLGLSFVVVWGAESLFDCTRRGVSRHRWGAVLCGLFLVMSALYGTGRISLFREKIQSAKDPLSVVLVQENIPLIRKEPERAASEDLSRLWRASLPYDRENTLIVWPESAIMHWIPTSLRSTTHDRRLPHFEHAHLLSGILSFKTQDEIFNSAVLIRNDGSLGPPYHKRILMPYGEYTPFSDLFPWLLAVNKMAGNFTPGGETTLHRFPTAARPTGLSAASLICYEDVVQSLATEAVREGAELLVNLTNDAWFGDSIALQQHHLIATFRAIENRRFHLRATNTGQTGVISPLGETVSSLPTGRGGVLHTEVVPLSELSLFSRTGNLPWWILAALCGIFVVLRSISEGVVRRTRRRDTPPG
ncbi:apolipoprotein N-acyltransferase [bacterium]|nr:apolipoprotein N-acyltransferase [bacterium]